MIILGLILAVIGFMGVNAIWSKNEWRYPMLEIDSALAMSKNPNISDFTGDLKRNGVITTTIHFALYTTGAVFVYWKMPRTWVLVVGGLIGLFLLKGLIGIFRTAYSPKIKLLNYLYSPYVLAWHRDHWSKHTDQEIAKAICSVVKVDPDTIQTGDITIEDFLFELCKKTRPKYEADKYPEVLKKLSDQASKMVWNG